MRIAHQSILVEKDDTEGEEEEAESEEEQSKAKRQRTDEEESEEEQSEAKKQRKVLLGDSGHELPEEMGGNDEGAHTAAH